MKILILVLNFNNKKNTIDCLDSLKKTKINKGWLVRTVVVDNASTDGSKKLIKKRYPDTKIIENKENLGFAGGNNVGLKWGLKDDFDFILLLNNDTLVDSNILIELIKVVKKNNQIGLVSPKIYFAPGFEFHKKRYSQKDRGKVVWYGGGSIDWNNVLTKHLSVDQVDKKKDGKIKEVDFATGCCMLINSDVLKKVGLFDEKYFLYWEDVDFSYRAYKKGFKIYYAPKALVWHKNAGSSASGSLLHDYYLTRNRLLFAFKFAKLKTKLLLVKESINLLKNGRKGQKQGIKDFFSFHFYQK
jgi:GT2 family glycosyltransferase